MHEANTIDQTMIGQAVIGVTGSTGYIAAIHEAAGNSFVLGAGMARIRHEFEIVFPSSGHVTRVPDGIAAPWIAKARSCNIPPADDIGALLDDARRREAETRAAALAEQSERRGREAEFREECKARIPAWAKAAIVAELEQDDCDSMSDYYNTQTKRRVIIGFSKHGRDLFPELRAAAATFAETADLSTAPDSAEHREKHSMGAGYYLKDGNRYDSGWAVRKHRFYDNRSDYGLNVSEWHLPDEKAVPPAAQPTPGGMAIEEHVHTKKGFQMHICILSERVERGEFDSLREKAESMGGWYSRPWGKTPGGFAFKDRAAAESFAGLDTAAGEQAESPVAASAEPVARPGMADKLLDTAARIQTDIDHCFRDRLTNTPKRMREAQSARLDGARWQRAHKAALALAAAHDAGTVPPVLATVSSKSKLFELVRTDIDRSRGGYYDAGFDTGRPSLRTPEAVALWAMLSGTAAVDTTAEDLRRELESLQFANIPGYFPTPPGIVARMIERAGLEPGMAVLEPSAGSGNIADAVKAMGVDVQCFEVNSTLAGVLKRKGHAVEQGDFLTWPIPSLFDRVLMNPPFEAGQDMAHVMRAFEWLKDGGRLVAIVSPGPFFRQDRKSAEFREWFESMGGDREDLPAGAFKSSGTGVASVLIEVRK